MILMYLMPVPFLFVQGLKIHELQQRKTGLYRDLHLMDKLARSTEAAEFDRFKKVLSLDNGSSDVSLLQKAALFGMLGTFSSGFILAGGPGRRSLLDN